MDTHTIGERAGAGWRRGGEGVVLCSYRRQSVKQ